MTAQAEDRGEPRTIAVSGSGQISAAPDVAEIRMGVTTHGDTARQALSENNQRMTTLLATLQQRGVAAKDVQTTHLSIQPQYAPPQPGKPATASPRITGYQVQNSVAITARDLAKFGELLDAVVDAGANEMNGVAFRLDQPEPLLAEARKRAMAEAKARASLLAGEAGVVVGPPMSIREESVMSGTPQPPVRYRAAMAGPGSVPMASGEQELHITVHVVYELQLPK